VSAPNPALGHTIEKARPGTLPQPLTAICAGLAVLGVAAFFYGLSTDPQTAWLAFHTNFIYFALLGQGGLIISAIFSTVGARWPGPYRRIAEGIGAWVPVSLVLLCVGYFGRDYIFEWSREGAVHGKGIWLNDARVYLSNIAVLAVLAVWSVIFLKTSLRPTLGGGTPGATGFAKTLSERWTSGWRGDREERDAADTKLGKMAPPFILFFALGYSAFVFDQVMSMEQTWFSNLFGAYVIWGGILGAMALTLVIGLLHRNAPGFEGQITEKRMHDIGKLVFGMAIFWMYLFFAQYLVIYYGNLPEETGFLRDRLGPQFVIDKGYTQAAWALSWTDWDFQWSRLSEGYGWVSMSVWLCNWIIPFWVLLGERPKKTPWIAGPVAALVVVGFWLERNLLIWPSVVKGDQFAWLGPVQLCIAAGFAGAFALVFLVYSRVFPSLALSEDGA
jgi:hypothetical protein